MASVSVAEPIDCRSEVGVTIGLIDSLIYVCRVLAVRPLDHPEVQEALLDLQGDEDLARLLSRPAAPL